MRGAILCGALLVCMQTSNAQRSSDETRYEKAGVRLEARTKKPVADDALRAATERALAASGVQARWIQMVTPRGAPLIQNAFIPCSDPDAPRNELLLKRWVEDIHRAGMTAVSWVPLSLNDAGWNAHPEWRQRSLPGYKDGPIAGLFCCYNSGFGDALIRYCSDAVDRLGLDGLWFDGAVLTPVWERPFGLSCACDACRAKFKADTGLELPGKLDWHDKTFRLWVAWRYRTFGAFIGHLAAEIHKKHPNAAIVINHYHRPGMPWRSAMPLDSYAAEIIAGSEGGTEEQTDLIMRLNRAYGRAQSEVWRDLEFNRSPEVTADHLLLQHALICTSAGGFPSFGHDWADPQLPSLLALIAPITNAVSPYTGGPSLPDLAIHVSQQTETFYFGRGETDSTVAEPFWSSLNTWTVGLEQVHRPPDYLFDADVVTATLARYRAVLMPLSICLSDTQAQAAIHYVKQGGTLLLGMGAGQRDAQGEPRRENPLGRVFGFGFGTLPSPDGAHPQDLRLISASSGPTILQTSLRAPLSELTLDWKPLLYADKRSRAKIAAAIRSFGLGHVILLDTDPDQKVGSTRFAGGNTRLEVTEEDAASGRRSLKFTDDPIAPESYLPDFENRVATFGAPGFAGGELECDLKASRDARFRLELRSSVGPVIGPAIEIGPNGHLAADGTPIRDVTPDTWFHLALSYGFVGGVTEGGAAATGRAGPEYRVTILTADGEQSTVSRPLSDPKYALTDWFVLYGLGTQPATLYLDNLKLRRVRADGSRESVIDQDFEAGEAGLQEPQTLVRRAAEWLGAVAPPRISMQGPAWIRIGAFRRPEGRLLVHLFNRYAQRADWNRESGPDVTLRLDFPVKSARLLFPARELAVRVIDASARALSRQGGSKSTSKPLRRWEIGPFSVGLYQVLELK